jgi:hypothetical protein
VGIEMSDERCSFPSTTQVDAVFNCLSGGAKDPGLASCHGVDCSSFWWNESFMEKPTFTRACLSDVRVTIEIMCVPVVEQPYQAVMGQTPALKCMLSGMCGCLLPCPIMLAIKCHCLLRTQPQQLFPVIKVPRRGCRGPGYVSSQVALEDLRWVDRW